MANTIGKVTEYLKEIVDEVITKDAKTSALQADPSIVRALGRAGTIEIATSRISSLGNYAGSYAAGDVTVSWEPYVLTHDRSIKVQIDRREESESGGIASAARAAGDLARQHVIPEVDATRMAAIAQALNAAGAPAGHLVTEALTGTGKLSNENILTKLGDGLDKVIDCTGIDEGHTIYINNSIYNMLRMSTEYDKVKELTVGTRTLNLSTMDIDGNPIVRMPTDRMFGALTYSATSATVGFTGAKPINYVITTPRYAQGVIAFDAPKFIPKENNPDADADLYAYRIFHDCFIPKEKLPGFYVSVQAALSS